MVIEQLASPVQPNVEPIPGYRLIERIGRGGYGEVWKAEAPGGILKAIKFVFGDMDGANNQGKAAEQEFKSLNRVKTIRHPFLLSLERIEIVDGQLMIVMELADRNLWDRFSEAVTSGQQGIPRAELLRYMEEAAEALDLMNFQYQLQHLDIKPQNIFLVHQHVKVADFGLAKDLEGARAEVTGGLTPTYAPPETFEGWVSRQSDQYSLAIVYQEMLTGRRPFTGNNTRQLILQHMTGTPDVSALPSPDREAVARALAKAPGDRFATCAEFVQDLKGNVAVQRVHIASSPTMCAGGPAVDEDTAQQSAAFTKRDSNGPKRRSTPALITPGAKSVHMASVPVTHLRSAAPDTGALSRMIPPPPERIGPGVLFPTVVVGIGVAGYALIRRLRALLQDRYGKPTLPHMRWLYLDTDPAAIEAAVAEAGGLGLTADEVILMRLRRPSHYLTRDGLPPIESWLSPETLYRMPRVPATDRIRAIGRLALCDHYHPVCARVRACIEAFHKPEPLAEAERATGLPLRSSHPRVYVASSLAGGTGSGGFLDLAYLIRKEFRYVGYDEGHVVGVLGVPPVGSIPPESSLALNTKAALLELDHFSRGTNSYRAQFDLREEAVADASRPFRRTTLFRWVPEAESASTEAAALGLYADLLTPAGRAAHPDDAGTMSHPHALVGVRRVVWPRSRVLQAAARSLAKAMLQSWLGRSANADPTVVNDALETQWRDRQLTRSSLQTALLEYVENVLATSVEGKIDRTLQPFAEGAAAAVPDVNEARTALNRLLEVVGVPGPKEADFPNELGALLSDKCRDLTAQADAKLAGLVVSMVEKPGARIGGAEQAIFLLHSRIDSELSAIDRDVAALEDRVVRDFSQLYYTSQASAPDGGTVRKPMSRQELASRLREWAIHRAQHLVVRACATVYRNLRGNIPEYTREVNFCKSALEAFVTDLDDKAAKAGAVAAPTAYQEVYPDGARSAAESANRLVQEIALDDWVKFEAAVQTRIRNECRALVSVCVRPQELGPRFLALMLDQATRFLDARIGNIPVVDTLLSRTRSQEDLEGSIAQMVCDAAPPGLGKEAFAASTLTILALPESEASHAIQEMVRECCTGSAFLATGNRDDIMIYRELRNVSIQSLPQFANDPVSPRSHDGRSIYAANFARADVAWARPASAHP